MPCSQRLRSPAGIIHRSDHGTIRDCSLVTRRQNNELTDGHYLGKDICIADIGSFKMTVPSGRVLLALSRQLLALCRSEILLEGYW